MLHDPQVYPEPFKFKPDRFMTDDGQLNTKINVRDSELIAFGFGRRYPTPKIPLNPIYLYFLRVCPGRFMAFSAVWIAVASMLSVFEISKLKDENGEDIEPSHEYNSTLLM
jgi:hypothetical protein